MLKRSAPIKMQSVQVNSEFSTQWARPIDVIESAYKIEVEYRGHIEAVAAVARKHGDELSVLAVADILSKQVDSVNEWECILKKARQYSALEGLYYHLDHELGKKG